MDEKKAKEFTDSIFNKLNDQERVYLAWIHNQKNKEIQKLKEENEFLKLSNPEMNIEHFRCVEENKRKIDNLRLVNKRLNNIINELKWKPIEEYDKGNYDWVLVKYFDGDYECVPCVAEKRFGKWHSIDEKEIQFDVKYFMDMQQIDKIQELKGSSNNE